MKILTFFCTFLVSVAVAVSLGQALAPASVSAAASPSGAASSCNPATSSQCVEDVCGLDPNPASPDDAVDDCNRFIEKYVNPAIKVLTALVGIAAVISLILAGIQYSASADDSGAVTKAKERIFNTVIGLIAYIFLLAFLNYLVPGGILR